MAQFETLLKELGRQTEINTLPFNTGILNGRSEQIDYHLYENGNVAVLNIYDILSDQTYRDYRNLTIIWYKAFTSNEKIIEDFQKKQKILVHNEKRIDFMYGNVNSRLHLAFYPERKTIDLWLTDKKQDFKLTELDRNIWEMDEIGFQGAYISNIVMNNNHVVFLFNPDGNHPRKIQLPVSIIP